MDRRRLAQRNLVIYWLVLIGLPATAGLIVTVWAVIGTSYAMN
jgi:hypothetical protein